MEDLKSKFLKSSEEAFQLPKQSNENLLELYALYKQSTEGDVRGSRPGLLQLKERAKFDAWATKRGMLQEKAMQAYIDLVSKLKT